MTVIMKKIGIVMGSDSDLPVVKKAVDTLKELMRFTYTRLTERLLKQKALRKMPQKTGSAQL